jgi:hypothetical protein
MAYFAPQYPFGSEQEQWILLMLARGIPQAEIYRTLSGEGEGRPSGVERWGGSYGAFRKRLARLTKGNSSRNTPGLVRHPNGEQQPVDMSTIQGQLLWLQRLINSSNTKGGEKLRAFEMLRELQNRLDGEKSNDGTAEYAREMLIGGHKIMADACAFAEVVSNQLTHALAEGYDSWCVDVLTEWLTSHPSIVQRVVERVVDVHPMRIVKDETSSEKLFRLRSELQSLSEAEVRALENGRDLEGGDDSDSD